MSVNMGQAVGYLDLDTSKFKTGLKSALADLKTFKSETATTQDKMSAFSSAATSTGKALTKGLTVPLAGIGVAAVAVTAKFDAGMSKVQAISGATAQDMEKLRAKAKEMGAQTKFSATQSAEAFSYMAMAGWKTEDMLDGIEGIMNLAAASGEDLATTSDIVTDALTAFGLKAEDSAHFADVLAAASSNANTNVSMMGETFKYVAPVAGALGFSVEDVSTAIGLMANSGIKGSQAGTALRNLFTRMAKPTKESAKAMEELGVSLTDSEGNMKDFNTIMLELRDGFSGLSEAEKAQAASALAGQYGMSGLLAIVNSSDKDFNKLKDSIYSADGAAQEMADTMMDNLPGAITLMKSALEGLGIRIGEVITPAVTKIVRVFTSFISWLSQASDSTVRFAVVLGAILAAIGPVLIITGMLAGAVANLITVYTTLSKVLAGKTVGGFIKAAAAKLRDAAATTVDTVANLRYQTSLRSGTGVISAAISKVLALAAAHKVAAGAVFGIIGVLAGLAIYMYKTGTSFSEMKDKILNMFNSFVEKAPEILSSVAELATGIVQGIVDKLPTILNGLEQMVLSIGQQLPGLLSQAMQGIGDMALQGLQVLKTVIPKFAEWWANDMPLLIETGSEMIVNLINGFAEAAPQMMEAQTEVITQMIDTFFEQVPRFIEVGTQMLMSLIQGVITAIPQLVSAISNILTTSIGPILTQLVTVAQMVASTLIANLPTLIQAVTTIILTLVQAIANNAPQFIAAAIKIITALAVGILKAMPQVIKAVLKITAALVKAALTIVGSMASAGLRIIKALWKGISGWAGAIRSNMRSLGKRLFTTLVAAIGNLVSTGAKWLMSLWQGIAGRIGSVIGNLRGKIHQFPSVVKGALGSLFSAGANFIAGLWNGMSSRISGVISSLRSKLSTVANLAKSIFKLGSPSKLMFQYGVWFMEGLENGIAQAYRPLMKSLNKQMDEIVSVYNPLSDYDFNFNPVKGEETLTIESEPTDQKGVDITNNIYIQEASNPEQFASRLVRKMKLDMRTV